MVTEDLALGSCRSLAPGFVVEKRLLQLELQPSKSCNEVVVPQKQCHIFCGPRLGHWYEPVYIGTSRSLTTAISRIPPHPTHSATHPATLRVKSHRPYEHIMRREQLVYQKLQHKSHIRQHLRFHIA